MWVMTDLIILTLWVPVCMWEIALKISPSYVMTNLLVFTAIPESLMIMVIPMFSLLVCLEMVKIIAVMVHIQPALLVAIY